MNKCEFEQFLYKQIQIANQMVIRKCYKRKSYNNLYET